MMGEDAFAKAVNDATSRKPDCNTDRRVIRPKYTLELKKNPVGNCLYLALEVYAVLKMWSVLRARHVWILRRKFGVPFSR